MATPEGTQATTSPSESELLSAVSSGESVDVRQDRAIEALKAGIPANDINRAFNAPIAVDGDKPEPESGKDTTTDKPEEARGNDDAKPKDQDKSKAEKSDLPTGLDGPRLEKYLVAKRVLARDNMTQEDLDALGVDRVIALGEKRSEVQRTIDQRFTQTPKKNTQSEDTGADEQIETDDEDLKTVLADLEEYDSELAKKVAKIAQKGSKSAEELQKQLNQKNLQVMVDSAKLKYPELKDEALVDSVLEKAARLASTGSYGSAQDALDDACVLLISPRRETQAQDRLLENNRAHRDGQIDSDTIIGDDINQPMNRDQREDLAIKLLRGGMDPEAVRRKVAKVPRAEDVA